MIKRRIYLAFQVLAGLASIAGFLFVLFSDEKNSEIALITFCACLFFFTYSLIIGIFLYVRNNNPAPYLIDATYSKIEYSSPTNGRYEFFKTLQNKRLFMDKYSQKLFWTGSSFKNLHSPLPYKITEKEEGQKIHTITFDFVQPILYNQITTIHLEMDLDDVDHTAEPWLSHTITKPTNLLYFSVVLKYKPDDFHQSAKVKRSPINNQAYSEPLCTVPFESSTKSYTYVVHPEVGYIYKLEWDK